MISIRELSLHYGKSNKQLEPALKNINLDIAAGESVAIMGQSGSGKSTLLAVLGGMLRPSSGRYEFMGQSVTDMSMGELADFRGAKIGFVFQNFFLLPHLTILENLLVPMEHVAVAKRVKMERAQSLLARVGIAHLSERFPAEVSGGQAQRAAIARALMRNPAVILADEPTGSLDQENADSILALLKSLSESGTTVVVVTHSVEVAKGLGRIVRIEGGRIVEPAHAEY